MNHDSLPNLPDFFETIGNFLKKVEVRPDQRILLKNAQDAYNKAMTLIYREAKIYPCTRTSKIPVIPVAKAAE